MHALEGLAELMPVVAAAFLGWGGSLVVFGWLGTTTLVLTLPAAERAYAVRGQNRMLSEFAELVAERVAQHGR
jgi:cyanate permease